MDHQSPSLNQITITQQQLNNQFFNYYAKLRSDQLPSLTSNIPNQFNNIQREIISIVQLRKNMEKTLEIDQLQSQHFNTVSNLVEKNMILQQSVNQMAIQIKQIEENYLSKYITSLKHSQKESQSNASHIIQKGQELLFELSDLRRSFNVQKLQLTPGQACDQQGSSVKLWKREEYFEQLAQSQQRRWDLARLIYSIKLKQILLRDQLVQQRQRAHLELQSSNSELIDTLLREKERDKNLRKKDNQKFGQIIKLRDQIDFQNQNLNHSQKTLVPILQNQLLKIKAHLRQQEERHQIQLQKANKKNEQLIRQLNKSKAESKLIEDKFTQKQRQLKDKVNQIRLALDESEQRKKTADKSIKLIQSKQLQKENQLQTLKIKYKELQKANDQLSNRNDQLQSQYNQLILKSSHLNHIKTDLSKKLQKNTKKVQQFESKLEQAKKILNEKNEELKSLQMSFNNLKSEKVHFQQLINSLQAELSLSKEHISRYQYKISNMQGEMTQNFITHNEQRSSLLYQVSQQQKQINSLENQLKILQQANQQAKIVQPKDQLLFALLQNIKEEINEQMRRGEKIKFNLIDQFVDKVNQYIQ